MRVLIVQNYDSTGLGQVCTALNDAGAERDYRRPYLGQALPEDCSGHDAVVVLGGGQSAVDDDIHPYLPHLATLMRCFAEAEKAVLGICLGSQILARAFGAQNLIGIAPEFGWQEVRLTADAKSDPVLSELPQAFPIFQWHDDTFTLPDGAIRLAANDATENQAFRVHRAAYGIQFHFEADRPLVVKWNERFADVIARKEPDWTERHPGLAERHGPVADDAGRRIAEAWVRQIRAA
jgi:GMP synthase-like glutamine amidotransferase